MPYGDVNFVPIVLGTGLNTYSVARSLHEAFGVRTLALGRFALRETAGSAIVDVRAYADFNKPERILEVLAGLVEEFPDRQLLLIANVEYYANVVLDNWELLSRDFVIPLVPPQVANRLMNKADFYRTCEELGVAHPASAIVSLADVEAGVSKRLPFGFPVVLKPSDTDTWGRMNFVGKQKIYVVQGADELDSAARSIYGAGYTGDLVVQEFLPGDESVMRVVNTYSDRHGRMRVLSAAQIVLGDPNPQLIGNYNAAVTMHDAAMTEQIRHLLDSVGYTGPANIDVMYDARTDTNKLLEINLRVGAASYYTTGAGINLARCFVDDYIHHQEIAENVGDSEQLWINVPRWVVRVFVPKSLRPLVSRARRAGVIHTLRYPRDASFTRRVNATRVSARHALDYVRYGRS